MEEVRPTATRAETGLSAELLAAARATFDPEPGAIYLDAATYGLPPRPTVAAMHRAVDEWQTGTGNWIEDWDKRGEVCRARFAELIDAPAECVALIPTVSVGVATIAARLGAADSVVVPDDEFTSLLFPILVAARERGADVKVVPLEGLADSVTASTTLVAWSLIQSHSGRAAALDDVLEAARRVGARTLVDATHAVPFVELGARFEQVDYLACAGYKHLLSPRGASFLYVAPSRLDDLAPVHANWRSSSAPYTRYYGGPLDTAPSAARFDVSLAWFAWVGASESLALLSEWRQAGVLLEPVRLARRLAERLGLPEPAGTLLSVDVDDAEKVRAALAEAGIRAAVRAGAVRFSPHVYNTLEQIERTADVMMRHVPQPV